MVANLYVINFVCIYSFNQSNQLEDFTLYSIPINSLCCSWYLCLFSHIVVKHYNVAVHSSVYVFIDTKFTQDVIPPTDQGVSVNLHVKTQAQERVQARQYHGSWIVVTICIRNTYIIICNASLY